MTSATSAPIGCCSTRSVAFRTARRRPSAARSAAPTAASTATTCQRRRGSRTRRAPTPTR
eukprot:5714894-Prymnesium_polylepis.1